MDLGKFETYVSGGKNNLEMLLFGKEPTHIKFKNFISNSFSQNPKDEKPTFPKCRMLLFGIPMPFSIGLGILSILPGISGFIKYGIYHEAGELVYLYPLYNFTDDSYKLKNNGPKIIRASKTTASDVFGDLLASTFSPLAPEQQLKLFEHRDIDTYDFTKKLRLREYAYVSAQHDTVIAYETRKKDDYVYGPELKDFYNEILKLQLGFDETKRKEFQLKLYDTAQKQIRDRLKRHNEINENNFAEILFNADELISDLKVQI